MNRTKVVISLGSNVPDAESRLTKAIEWLGNILDDLHVSQIYMTNPISGIGADYANAVAWGITESESPQLARSFKRYEVLQGRDLVARTRGEVPIDLDLVYFGNICLRPAEINRSYYVRGAEMLGLMS